VQFHLKSEQKMNISNPTSSFLLATTRNDPVSLLYNEAQQHGLNPPAFKLISSNEKQKPPVYTWSCSFLGLTLEESGSSRKDAKARVAMAMVAAIKYESLPERTSRRHRRASLRQTR